jgi:hypothetical protein
MRGGTVGLGEALGGCAALDRADRASGLALAALRELRAGALELAQVAAVLGATAQRIERVARVVYVAERVEALADLERCLRAGRNVVSTAFYPLLHPKSAPRALLDVIEPACAAGGSSVFVSGVDPGWALDILPALVSGVGAGITEIRMQELFDYALYDQPSVVRDVIGFGGPMDRTPLMLLDSSLQMVWAPMLRVLGDLLGLELEAITTHVERRPLERDVEVPGMGRFERGTQGAFRFEVRGILAGRPLLVVEHVTRIGDACAPDWPRPTSPGGEHRVLIAGHPNLVVTVHGTETGEPGAAGGGNASAANRIVNAIPAVCAAPPGPLGPLDLPPISAARQIRS